MKDYKKKYEESEDERIRKQLIEFVNQYGDKFYGQITKASTIAWLEKQSHPQVRTGNEWVNTIDDACNKRYSEEYAHGEYCHEQSFRWGFQEGVDWFEKHCEQKMVSKTEPIVEGLTTEFQKQVSHLIASAMDKEHEYNEGFVKWAANALLNYAKHELEEQVEHKPDTKCLLSWSETDEKMLQSLEGIVKDYWAKAEQEKNEIKIREASNVSYFLKTIQKSSLCWIKCSDGLPNRDGTYLVVTDGRHNDVYDMARYDSIEGWHKASEIIYWMPIPQLNNKSIIEQKPTDKVEPKFKVGNWVVNEEMGTIHQIKELIENVTNKAYGYELTDGRYISTSKVDKYHLWTIQDAKNGDVLVASDGSIFIFKEIEDCGCKHYIALEKDSKTVNMNDNLKHFWESIRSVKPATEEQRDLLFSKMKEAGYEWDAEKKELKKIEHKTTIGIDNSFDNIKFPFKAKVKSTDAIVIIHDGQLSVDGKEWIKYQSNKDDGYRVYRPEDLEFICNLKEQIDTINTTFKLNDCILDENGFAIQSEQKPADKVEQEEDVELTDFESALFSAFSDAWQEYLSGKEVNVAKWTREHSAELLEIAREQKPAWNEEDENILNEFVASLKYSHEQGYNRQINWLKSLKNRVKLQPKQELSEDVEAAITLLKDIAEEQEEDYCPYNANDLRKAAQYLETCRPQPQWKPSDEQMKALWDSIPENVKEISEREMLLDSLYQDLKKLREE